MANKLTIKPGITPDKVVNVPKNWDPEWFRLYVANLLEPLDPRNSTPGPGMIIGTSGINNPATLGPGAINPTVTPAQVPAGSTDQGVPVHGNIMPMVQSQSFNYTSTATTINFTWPSFVVYRPDGVTQISISSGSMNVTSLTANTTYFAYAYSLESAPSTILFVTGLPGAIGSPAICFPATSVTYAQTAAALAAASVNAGYFQGKLTGVTPASGSGGGGGGGGGYGCPRADQMVQTETGTDMACELEVGDKVMTPSGWQPIVKLSRHKQQEWIQVKCDGTAKITVTPDHRFGTPEGSFCRADELHLGSLLAGNGRNLEVVSLSLVREGADAISLELDDPHVYFFTRTGPLNHNLKP